VQEPAAAPPLVRGSTPARQRPQLTSLCGFLALAAVAIAALQLGHAVFPGARGTAQVGRALCSMAAIVALVTGSCWLLRREGIAVDRLGLSPGSRHGRAFAIGTAIAVVHILLLVAALYVVAPFSVSAGPLPMSSVAVAAAGYLAGNFVEELLFRGYLLVVLSRWLGTTTALWVLALPFGLFHFPGLDLPALGKMVLTTGAMHFVYGYAWIATRSLAAAVALHAVGNTLLHEVVGIGKPAALAFHVDKPAPDGVLFLIFFGISAALAWTLSRLPATRQGAAWLEGAPNLIPRNIQERTRPSR
jgi:membrane protease YdiL (CAAX protease family)